ncbi:MAG: site-specific integrase [Oscillospiraceae bacterium]|nr:site-specific integrase [Oscillospiraceae bacterium]MBR3517578.1 site-specific integrase [Lachnospiraceae bacterium]
MATAKQLPSGSWRCQVYDYTDANGKKHYHSITCPDPSQRGKHKCEQMADEWMEQKETQKNTVTFSGAATEYIALRTQTLSPRTLEDYRKTLKNYCGQIADISISKITQQHIQAVINSCSEKLAPKTVSNIHAFISSVLREYRPNLVLNTRLPQRVRPDLYVPTDEDIGSLIERIQGTAMELPVMLAAFGPMRRGEICALDTRNINGNVVHVCENMIKQQEPDQPRKWIIRHPKSYHGDRYIEYPDMVADLWNGKTGRLVTMTPDVLTAEFKRYLRSSGLQNFRFHDLRHYSASIQHALGIPDAYIMARGGWSTDTVLKQIYRHTMSDHQKEMNQKANDHFSKIVSHEISHEKEKPQ